ncbi:MAG: MFS transporter [Bdellovibrionia bacterium]
MNTKMGLNIFIVYLVLFEFTVYMANDLIMPGMLNVVHEFNSSDAFIPLSLSLYLLGGMLLQLIMGPVSDKIGRRPTMIAGCIFFVICTFVIILSSSMHFFLAARFFQGMGLCFIGVCGYATVQELFEEKKAVRVVAWMTTTSVTAPILGPIIGGLFIQSFNWRWIFVSTLLFSVLSLWGIWKYMPETVQLKGSQLPKRKEKASFHKLKKISFKPMWRAYRSALSNRVLVLGGCLSGFLAAPILCWIAISPIVLFENAKISAELYGIVQIPVFGFFILGNFILRKLTYKYTLKRIIQIAFPICITSLVILFLFPHYYPDSYWSLVLPLSLFCLGNGIINAPITRLSLFSSDTAKGTASAVYGLISNVVLIAAVSVMPLVFQGKNADFGLFCLICGIVIAFILERFLKLLPTFATSDSVMNLGHDAEIIPPLI